MHNHHNGLWRLPHAYSHLSHGRDAPQRAESTRQRASRTQCCSEVLGPRGKGGGIGPGDGLLTLLARMQHLGASLPSQPSYPPPAQPPPAVEAVPAPEAVTSFDTPPPPTTPALGQAADIGGSDSRSGRDLVVILLAAAVVVLALLLACMCGLALRRKLREGRTAAVTLQQGQPVAVLGPEKCGRTLVPAATPGRPAPGSNLGMHDGNSLKFPFSHPPVQECAREKPSSEVSFLSPDSPLCKRQCRLKIYVIYLRGPRQVRVNGTHSAEYCWRACIMQRHKCFEPSLQLHRPLSTHTCEQHVRETKFARSRPLSRCLIARTPILLHLWQATLPYAPRTSTSPYQHFARTGHSIHDTRHTTSATDRPQPQPPSQRQRKPPRAMQHVPAHSMQSNAFARVQGTVAVRIPSALAAAASNPSANSSLSSNSARDSAVCYGTLGAPAAAMAARPAVYPPGVTAVDWLHTQLDAVTPATVVLNRFQFLGRPHRAHGSTPLPPRLLI